MVAERIIRLTVAAFTPGVPRSARCTCDWQAAQVMPSTGKVTCVPALSVDETSGAAESGVDVVMGTGPRPVRPLYPLPLYVEARLRGGRQWQSLEAQTGRQRSAIRDQRTGIRDQGSEIRDQGSEEAPDAYRERSGLNQAGADEHRLEVEAGDAVGQIGGLQL